MIRQAVRHHQLFGTCLLALGSAVASNVWAEGQEPRAPEPEDAPGEVGQHGGQPYFTAFDDRLRLYPGARVRTDFTWSPVPDDLPEALAGEAGEARLALRRLRLEVSGEVVRRVAFTVGAEMGGERIGQTPYIGEATPRYIPADAHDGDILPAEVSLSYMPLSWLSFTVGQVNAPFSMSNRTREYATPYLERNIAIRGFAVPYNKAVGAMAWGEVDERLFVYEAGVFSGGPNEPLLQGAFDAMGRLYFRPLATVGDGVFFDLMQIGVSARYGERDPDVYTLDYPTIATNNGFALWQPGYIDSLDRVTKVIPSGAQRAIGGELRVPFRTPIDSVFDLRGEAYYVNNDTREAILGFESTNTERLGNVEGVSWYASLAWWACFIPTFEQLVTGEPGVTRPPSKDDERAPAFSSALEASILAGGIHATYDGASRLDSTPDANAPAGDITIYQFGGAVQYWLGTNLRLGVNYMAYLAPDSGDAEVTQVVVPDNLERSDGSTGDLHVQHEVGVRLAASF